MTTFLKGDSSAEITLVLAEGCDYSGKTLYLSYQGALRVFPVIEAGGTVAFSFTAKETASMSLGAYPVRVWLKDEDGGTVTIHNGAVKLRVTDCVADVRSDEAMYLDVRGGLYGLDGLPDRWNENDLKAKIDEIIRRLGGTVALLLSCALPAFCAGPLTVQTAPKGEVYNDAQIVTNIDFDVSALAAKADATNTYTKAETDAAIVRLAPAPGNYAAVSNAAMDSVSMTTGGVMKVGAKLMFDDYAEYPGTGMEISADGIRLIDHAIEISSDGNSISVDNTDVLIGSYYLHLQRDDLEYLNMEEALEQLDAATETNAAQTAQIASHSSQLSQQSQSISTMGSQLNTIGSTLNAEDAKFEITNYNSSVHIPEASFSVKVQNEQTGSNEWLVAWCEMTRWKWFLDMYDLTTNALWAALANKSEKEYAFYDGVTGKPAPDGFFWIAQPRIAICAGMSYQRYVDSGAAVWVLESNGMVTDVNGTTNGFFRISDEEGNVQFEIIKGNRRTLAAAPRTMTSSVMGITHYFTSYATTNAVSAPVAKFCRDIGAATPQWYAETDEGCPMNAEWTDKGGGIYELEWWPKSTEPTMFMKAEYETGGVTRIVQHAPVKMQKIMIGDVEYTIGTAQIQGVGTVMTLTATP